MRKFEDEDDFLRALSARARQFADRVESGDLEKGFANFELLASIFSAHEGAIDKERLAACYPVQAWREDRVEVPRALLRELVEAWCRYRTSVDKTTLERELGIAAKVARGSPAKRVQATRDRHQRLSNLAVLEYLNAQLSDKPISWEAAYATVAESENASFGTVQAAHERLGAETMSKLQQAGLPLPAKT